MAAEEKSMPFIKHLASSDRKIRTAALSSLRSFLSARNVASALTPADMLKLWKGLFVALWMCDRPVPQQNLCADLAGLLALLPRDAAVPWLRGFWATMAREWTTGIDVLRMNKFLLLVRRVLEASLRWMRTAAPDADGRRQGTGADVDAAATWDAARADDMLALLAEWPFAPDDEAPRTLDADPHVVPVGLRIHALDVWVDEADKAGLLDEEDEGAREIVQRIAALVDVLEQRTTSKAVRLRAKQSLEDERLPGNQAEGQEEEMAEAGDGDSWDGFED